MQNISLPEVQVTMWLLHLTKTILLNSASVTKPFLTAWKWGLVIYTIPLCQKLLFRPSSQLSVFVFLLVLVLRNAEFLLGKKIATFTQNHTSFQVNEMCKCTLSRKTLNTWFQCLSYDLSIYESLYITCNGIWRIFLIGKIGIKEVKIVLASIWQNFHVFSSLEDSNKQTNKKNWSLVNLALVQNICWMKLYVHALKRMQPERNSD